MPIIDNEPCRYCGRNDGAHALTCDFGIAEVAARQMGYQQAERESRELLESCWAHLNPVLLEDGTPHPGERSIIHELFERLRPERAKK